MVIYIWLVSRVVTKCYDTEILAFCPSAEKILAQHIALKSGIEDGQVILD
jgi:hypothetical protein